MQIRHAKPGDEAALAFLLEDNQRHYGHAVKDGDGSALAAELVDPPAGGMLCLVADDGARLAGFALLNPYLPGAHFTRGLNYCRIDWTTDAANPGAQRLYDRLGGPRHGTVFYRLSGDHLKKFAEG